MMTEQQIIEMLATKVMGWHKAEFNGAERWYKECGNPVERINWNPLKNIADAWIIVEQIEKDGFDIQIYRGQGYTSVEIIESSQGILIGEYEGETTQDSICHAALRVFAADFTQR